MFRFPHDVYVDVRIVESHNTEIRFKELVLQSQKSAPRRSLDPGIRWHPLVLRFDHRSGEYSGQHGHFGPNGHTQP